jgi:hypothetical protein
MAGCSRQAFGVEGGHSFLSSPRIKSGVTMMDRAASDRMATFDIGSAVAPSTSPFAPDRD